MYTIVFVDFFVNKLITNSWQMNVKNVMLFTALWRSGVSVVGQRSKI